MTSVSLDPSIQMGSWSQTPGTQRDDCEKLFSASNSFAKSGRHFDCPGAGVLLPSSG